MALKTQNFEVTNFKEHLEMNERISKVEGLNSDVKYYGKLNAEKKGIKRIIKFKKRNTIFKTIQKNSNKSHYVSQSPAWDQTGDIFAQPGLDINKYKIDEEACGEAITAGHSRTRSYNSFISPKSKLIKL